MDNPFKSPTVLSVCSGLRGLEKGVEKALVQPIRVACYVEIDAFIMANILAGMEAGVVAPSAIWTNLKTFPYWQFYGKLDGLLAGYPCQPFSFAGLQLGEEDYRHLWPYIYYIIKFTGVGWCLFENVEGHLSQGYDRVKSDLEGLGYTVKEGLYSAEECGAPHRRKRLFILAVENSLLQRIGRWHDDSIDGGCQVQASGSGHLGYTKGGQQQRDRIQPGESEIETRGSGPENLVYTYSFDGGLPKAEGRFGDRQVTGPSEEMAHNNNPGCFEPRWPSPEKQAQPPFEHSSERSGQPVGRWPSRPGKIQYDWEHPRTIKPGLGCTIDGYNFREDLLRAIGNGVVEQTAALAFSDLIRKHGLSHLIKP